MGSGRRLQRRAAPPFPKQDQTSTNQISISYTPRVIAKSLCGFRLTVSRAKRRPGSTRTTNGSSRSILGGPGCITGNLFAPDRSRLVLNLARLRTDLNAPLHCRQSPEIRGLPGDCRACQCRGIRSPAAVGATEVWLVFGNSELRAPLRWSLSLTSILNQCQAQVTHLLFSIVCYLEIKMIRETFEFAQSVITTDRFVIFVQWLNITDNFTYIYGDLHVPLTQLFTI